MANIIASGTSELASAEFTLAAGSVATVYLGGVESHSKEPQARIQIKSDVGTWDTIATLTKDNRIHVIDAVGTFRVLRLANSVAFSVEKN